VVRGHRKNGSCSDVVTTAKRYAMSSVGAKRTFMHIQRKPIEVIDLRYPLSSRLADGPDSPFLFRRPGSLRGAGLGSPSKVVEGPAFQVTSATTWLRSTPTPLTSTSMTSPGFIHSGGLRLAPTPPGVPLTMTSPGSSGQIVEI
jgi:hypothetical protein